MYTHLEHVERVRGRSLQRTPIGNGAMVILLAVLLIISRLDRTLDLTLQLNLPNLLLHLLKLVPRLLPLSEGVIQRRTFHFFVLGVGLAQTVYAVLEKAQGFGELGAAGEEIVKLSLLGAVKSGEPEGRGLTSEHGGEGNGDLHD